MSSLEDVRNEFIRIYEDILSKRGLSPILGRILAVFFLEGKELSQQEISTLSGYSISSVSRALDQLIQMGVLYKQKDPRFLRLYQYRININLQEMVSSSLDTIILNNTKSLVEVNNLAEKIHSINQESETEEGVRIEHTLTNFGESMKNLIEILKEVKEKLREH